MTYICGASRNATDRRKFHEHNSNRTFDGRADRPVHHCRLSHRRGGGGGFWFSFFPRGESVCILEVRQGATFSVLCPRGRHRIATRAEPTRLRARPQSRPAATATLRI